MLSVICRETLTDLVERASLQCRKNTLWSQMVQIPRESDRRSVSDPSKSRGSVSILCTILYLV